jgi:hypothetical protein
MLINYLATDENLQITRIKFVTTLCESDAKIKSQEEKNRSMSIELLAAIES